MARKKQEKNIDNEQPDEIIEGDIIGVIDEPAALLDEELLGADLEELVPEIVEKETDGFGMDEELPIGTGEETEEEEFVDPFADRLGDDY
jgi:hypothetical protein